MRWHRYSLRRRRRGNPATSFSQEGYDYDAAASTVRMKEITSDKANQKIIRRLKDNDPTFQVLRMCKTRGRSTEYDVYCPKGARELGQLPLLGSTGLDQ